MESTEIQALAEELVNDMMAAEALQKVEAQRQEISQFVCPHCRYGRPRETSVNGVKNCRECRAFFGEEFEFQFPAWAQGKKAFFRRALCLVFNIQAKPGTATKEKSNGKVLSRRHRRH